MPEGSGLGGVYAEVAMVLTRVGCTTTAAEAGDASQSSAPSAATAAAHTKRGMPSDDACRVRFDKPTRCFSP